MKRLLILISALVLTSMPVRAVAETTITRESLDEMFESLKAKTKWNLDGPLLWGYFFTDHDPKKFTRLRARLEKLGYRYVGILEPEEAETNKTYFLHVERVENHTPRSLHARNQQLSKLAKQFGVEAYDGMDVGEVAK
jgi:hypothetical protein